jgi:beta-glucanase (GH16 family)
MSEKWYNRWLQVRAAWMRFTRWDDLINIPNGTPEHIDNFWETDKFNRFELSKNYHLQQPWGQYHPSKTCEFYDADCIKFHSGKGMELWVDDDIFEETIIIDRGVGLVCSKFNLTYGLYEWNVTLPKGSYLWPAIWLTHMTTWPPEIDVLEAYTDKNGKYKRRIETNSYYGYTPHNESSRSMRHGHIINVDDMINLKMLWDKNFIKIYYNNILVRRITESMLISQLNQDPWMKVIMNNSIRQKDDINKQSISPMIIQNFVYYKIK